MSEYSLEVVSSVSSKISGGITSHAVLKDTTTGVLYHYLAATNRATMTPIIDADGKPVVAKPE